MGGANVRAYESASFSGGKGYAFEIETQYAPESWRGYLNRFIPQGWGGGDVKGVLSYQQGGVTYYDPQGNEMGKSGYVASLTPGLQFRVTPYITGELNFPIPLGDTSGRSIRNFLFILRGSF